MKSILNNLKKKEGNIDVTVFFFNICAYKCTFTCSCNQTNSYSVDNLHNELFIKNCPNPVPKVHFSFV